jgi:ribosomal protein L16 Arg81 hydroxylase
MERAHAKLREAAGRARTELNYAGDVSFRAYLSPPGSGFGLHFDARVATTLQISGRKRWWYSKTPEVPFPTCNSARGPVRYPPPALDTLQSVVLQPGDVLCLPAGVWHCAKAEGNNMSLALNMAFDHNGGGIFDSIVDMLQQRLTHDPQWREPFPVVPGEARSRIPAPVAAVLRERIDALQAELAALREDEAALTRAWHHALRPRP